MVESSSQTRGHTRGRSQQASECGLNLLRNDWLGIHQLLIKMTKKYLGEFNLFGNDDEEGDNEKLDFLPIRVTGDPEAPVRAFSVEDPILLDLLGEHGSAMFMGPYLDTQHLDIIDAIAEYRDRIIEISHRLLMERYGLISSQELSFRLEQAKEHGFKILAIGFSRTEDYPVLDENAPVPTVEELPLVEEIRIFPIQIAVITGPSMQLYVEDLNTGGYGVVELPAYSSETIRSMEYEMRREYRPPSRRSRHHLTLVVG